MTSNPNSIRFPWVAMALSFLSQGLGHIYCGRMFKGLVLYFAWFSIPILAVVASFVQPSSEALIFLVLCPVFAVMCIYIYAAIDAFILAKQVGSSYELKDYNRASLYFLLVLIQLAYPVTLTLGVRKYVYEAFYIPTRSMNPNILAGDRILVNKKVLRETFPERGDLIAFRNPQPTGGQTFIGRVVAVAGDRIEIRGSEVEVNGKKLERERVPPEAVDRIRTQIDGQVFYESNGGRRYKVLFSNGTPADKKDVTIEVPARSVFVMGDNRNLSRDSRYYGPIHAGDIFGYIDYIYCPAESWTRFGAIRE